MPRIEEAQQILNQIATPPIGLSALGIATYDLERVVKAYRSLFEGGLLKGQAEDNVSIDYLLHGIVLWQLHKDHQGSQSLEALLTIIYPDLVNYQLSYYLDFCPQDNGLFVREGEIDPRLNSIIAWSNESVIELGYHLGLSSHDLFEKNELTLHSMNDMLWDESMGVYHHYDVDSKTLVKKPSSAGFFPLIAGAPDINQVLIIVHRMFGDDFRQEGYYSIPSLNLNLSDVAYGSPNLGAISALDNWFIIQGLLRYDMEDLADVVIEDTLSLIEGSGICDYFDPRKSKDVNGLGETQSVTAAAIYLLLNRSIL